MKLLLNNLPINSVALAYVFSVGTLTGKRKTYESMSAEAAFVWQAAIGGAPVALYAPNEASRLASRAKRLFGIEWGHRKSDGVITVLREAVPFLSELARTPPAVALGNNDHSA